jgi:hypothetical protein
LGFTESKKTSGIERILPRHEFEARVKIEVVRGEEKIVTDGWARDLSESGMGAFVGTELFLGERVTIRIPLGNDVELAVPAQIARNLGTEYGFQFVALSRTQRDQIGTILAASKALPYSPAN